MPTPMIKSQAKKHGCSVKTAEKKWKEAKKIIKKSYDKDDPKFWPTVTKVFKNKLKKHCESKILKFNEFINERKSNFKKV
jgi:hypothetical protein